MSSDRIADPARHDHAQQRLQTFLDCVAYLLAKRWLRECKDEKRKKTKIEPTEESSAKKVIGPTESLPDQGQGQILRST